MLDIDGEAGRPIFGVVDQIQVGIEVGNRDVDAGQHLSLEADAQLSFRVQRDHRPDRVEARNGKSCQA